jgi:BON domain-containing protein
MQAPNTTETKTVADQHLERRIALALLTVRMARFRFQHVHVDQSQALRLSLPGTRSVVLNVQQGAVTLSGRVPHAGEKTTLDLLVRRVPGVTQVIDKLQVVAKGSLRFSPSWVN